MEIQTAVYTTIIITIFMAIVLVIINRQLVKFDPLSEPKGIVLLVIMFEQYVEKLVKDKTNDDVSKYLTPYIMTVAAYIFLANIAGLFSNCESLLSLPDISKWNLNNVALINAYFIIVNH